MQEQISRHDLVYDIRKRRDDYARSVAERRGLIYGDDEDEAVTYAFPVDEAPEDDGSQEPPAMAA